MDARALQGEMQVQPPERILQQTAFQVYAQHAPKKTGDEEPAYIPLFASTKKRKNSDLMIFCHLLPEIANQVYHTIQELDLS